jgi:hypothetical protein
LNFEKWGNGLKVLYLEEIGLKIRREIPVLLSEDSCQYAELEERDAEFISRRVLVAKRNTLQ